MTDRLSKTQRQHRIAKLLEDHQITNQTQLVEMLATDGVALIHPDGGKPSLLLLKMVARRMQTMM